MRCTNLHFDGLTDETINQGADFNVLEGVKAYDADGNEVAFSVEPDELDSCVVGEQTLVYKAMGKDNRLIPSMCIPKDSNGANLPLGCTLTLLKENRKITVLQADPPRFTMNDVTIPKNTTLDVLDEVSAVDDNGNPITDIDYSGTLDKEVSGDIVSIEDGDERYPVKSLKVTLAPIQSGSGTPSPDNARPISGHTEVNTQRTGINAWDEEWERGIISWAGNNAADGTTATRIRSKNYIPVLPNTTYYVKSSTTDGNLQLFYYDKNKQFISFRNSSIANSITIIPDNTYYMRFYTYSSNYGATYKNDISINYPSTDTDYHPYQGTSYTTDLGRTVYGGTLDVVSGTMTLDRILCTFDGSNDESWGVNSVTGGYAFYIPNLAENKISQTPLCNYFLGVSPRAYTNLQAGECALTTSPHNYTNFLTNVATTVAEWRAYLAEHPLEVVYELATPQTYQLDPQSISLLHGNNTVWSDGEVEMVYSVELPTNGEVSYPLEGEYEITYSATDKCGNIGEAIRHITVQ